MLDTRRAQTDEKWQVEAMQHALQRGLPLLLIAFELIACRDESRKGVRTQLATASAAPSSGQIRAAPGTDGTGASAPAEPAPSLRNGITWFHDAPNAALAHARREKKPVIVDLWAGWCHTCLSMQEYVLSDAKLPGVRDRFVFLAVDTENPNNAAFLQKLAVSVWPTFYVLGPEDGEIRGRWLGAATPSQFMRFLKDAELALEPAAEGADASLARLRRGDALAAERRFAEAAVEYEHALGTAPVAWTRRPEAVLALAAAHKQARAFSACVAVYSSTPSLVEKAPLSAADLAATALTCATELPPDSNLRQAVRRRARGQLEQLCTNAHAELTPDDRADACGLWFDVSESLEDKASRARAGQTRLAVLEAAAQGVPDEVAAMYDFARSDTLVKLGRGNEAITLLQARAQALPRNYNPPHQLARVFRALKRWDEGLAAIDRALPLAYGPRKLGLLGVKVDLLLGAGRKEAALVVLREQLDGYRALPDGQKRPEAEAKVAERLQELAETSAGHLLKTGSPDAKSPK
jgi:thiol-disulfide isomerase/thioredoxin